ncbi:hypothetical protein M108_4583, partial [Bacteroides fragilis str. 3397 T14]
MMFDEVGPGAITR